MSESYEDKLIAIRASVDKCMACEGFRYKYVGPTGTPKCIKTGCHNSLQNVAIEGSDHKWWRCASCKTAWKPELCFHCHGLGKLTPQEVKDRLFDIEHAVKEGKRRCPDYPWTQNTASEAVWAVGCSQEGLELACQDWSEYVERLKVRIELESAYGMEWARCCNQILKIMKEEITNGHPDKPAKNSG